MFVSVYKLSSFSTKTRAACSVGASEGTVIGSAGWHEREANEVEMNYTQPPI